MTHTKPRVIAPLTAATLIAQQVGGTGMRDGLFLSHFAVKAFRISRHVHIRVLNAVRCTLMDIRLPNYVAPERSPEDIDPGVSGGAIVPGGENRRGAKRDIPTPRYRR